MSKRISRRLNVKLLFRTTAGIAILAGLVHLVHSHQMYHNAGAMLGQADRAFQREEYAKAADLLQGYLEYAPDDNEATALYATALEKGVPSSQARFKTFLLLEQLLRRQPEKESIRLKAVQAAIDVGRNSDAIRHLEYLLAASPNNAELYHRLGWCQEAVGQYEASAKSFARAIELAPGQIDSYVLLADLLRRNLKQPEEAGKVMDAMVAANAASWRAYLSRAEFSNSQGRVNAATADSYKAAELAPQQKETVLAAAEMALLQGAAAEAWDQVSRAIVLYPKNERLYRSLATVQTNWRRFDKAIACVQSGLEELPESVNLHVQLAELFFTTGQTQDSRKMLDWLTTHRASPGLVQYLEGRQLMADGRWPQAIEKLLGARNSLGTGSEWSSNLSACLARCHERLGDIDWQLGAYRDALVANPTNVDARLQMGQALLAAGFVEEAWLELRHLSSLPQAPPLTWDLLAQALLKRYQSKPPAAPEWNDLDTVLKTLAAATPDNAALPCLQAELDFARGDSVKALQGLQIAVARYPLETRPWTTLADIQAKMGLTKEAEATLAKAQQTLGPCAEIFHSQLHYWAAHPGQQASTALAQIGKSAAALPADDRLAVYRMTAKVLLHLGDKREAELALARLVTLVPNDLNSRILLFDLVLNDGRDAEAAAMLAEIRRQEGEEGARWRAAEAARGIWKAWKGDKSQLVLARLRLAEVRKRRPDWGHLYLLDAYLEELEGQDEQAMRSYHRAIDLGESPPDVAMRVAQWLRDQHRFTEAVQVLCQLENSMPLPREHALLAAELALQSNEPSRAIMLAHKAVTPKSRDYRDKLWLAHIQWLGGQPLEAEATLREAVKLAPRVPDVWVALVRHLSRTRLTIHLEQALDEMAEKIPADRAEITQARCLEAVCRLEEAEAAYQKLAANNVSDFAAIRQLAEFYIRRDEPSKAEPVLRQLLEPSADASDLSNWARRQLAVALALRNQSGDIQEALSFLDAAARSNRQVVENNRLRAFVMSRDSDRRAEAMRLFEETLPKQPLSPDEQFMLAKVYDANGEGAKSSGQMRALLSIHRDKPQYLAYHIQSLLNRGEREVAYTYLSALEVVEPNSQRTQQLRSAYQKARSGR